MANKLKAISTYRPKIKKGETQSVEKAAAIIAGRTSINEGDVMLALREFFFVIQFFLSSGLPLKLNGLGTFSPSISLDGTIKISLRVDKKLLGELNKEGAFTGTIVNKTNAGKSSEDLVLMWNEEHPDDPVE